MCSACVQARLVDHATVSFKETQSKLLQAERATTEACRHRSDVKARPAAGPPLTNVYEKLQERWEIRWG